MPPIPSPAPSTLTGYSAPYSAAGGGNQFQASGECSGTAWTHTQDLTIFYQLVTLPQNAGTWLPSTSDVSGIKLTVYGNAEDSLGFFATSSVSGASGCDSAADARQAHIFTLSSTTGSTGMGTAGAIYTLSGGYERRWSRTGDTDRQDDRVYVNGLFEVNGLPTGWWNNDDLSNNVIRMIVKRVCNGGIRYSNDGGTPPTTASNWALMKGSLMDI